MENLYEHTCFNYNYKKIVKLGLTGLYIGGAEYFITPSVVLCDWVVYAVSTGE